MIVGLDDLKKYGLFDNLPNELKTLENNQFYVIYYQVDEENLKLNIKRNEIVKDVNVSLYKNNTPGDKVGYFANTFDTKDGLFFQLLKTFNDTKHVYEFYNEMIEQDKITDLSVSVNAINDVYTPDDFKRTISYFSPNRLQTIMFAYDMVDEAFRKKLSKRLYGDSIKRVVNLVKFEAGILREYEDSLVRFMVIGEKAVLTKTQKEKLEEAKNLIRSNYTLDKIYSQTGWILGDKDGKWRTNISDYGTIISNANLIDYSDRKLYVPQNTQIDTVLPLIVNPQLLYSIRYTGVLSEVLNHPTLYNYYPRLANLPLVYFFQDKQTFEQNKKVISTRKNYYFSDNSRGGLILMNGDWTSGSAESILLHETQHAIQHIEEFARGGNLFLARFVASLGSDYVRKVFSCINKLEKLFYDKLLDENSRLEIVRIISEEYLRNRESNETRNQILEFCSSQTTYEENYTTINFLMVLLISEQGDFATSNIVAFFENKFGNYIYELFEFIEIGYKKAMDFREYLSSSYSEKEIGTILFESYNNLYGEMESRSVQSSRFLQNEYRNYFYLTSWERGPIQELTVIDGITEIIETSKIKAAVESKENNYVLHFLKDRSSLPYIHELGHIVHDALVLLGYEQIIVEEFSKDLYKKDVHEFFVSKFMAYLKSNLRDEKFLEDMKDEYILENAEISRILDEFFDAKIKKDEEISGRINYLRKLLLLIDENR